MTSSPSSAAGTIAAQTLVLRINGFRKLKGVLRLAIFASAEGYPKSIDRAVRSGSFEVDETSLEIELPDLPYGQYAVTVHHDENEDGKLNFNPLGIPTEGIGFSGNPPIWHGAPAFEKAAFQFEAGHPIVTITMKYLLQ